MNGFLFVIDEFDGRHYVIRLCMCMLVAVNHTCLNANMDWHIRWYDVHATLLTILINPWRQNTYQIILRAPFGESAYSISPCRLRKLDSEKKNQMELATLRWMKKNITFALIWHWGICVASFEDMADIEPNNSIKWRKQNIARDKYWHFDVSKWYEFRNELICLANAKKTSPWSANEHLDKSDILQHQKNDGLLSYHRSPSVCRVCFV